MQTVFLHMGTPKTGTTSLQERASRDRRWLADRGLIYPDSAPILGGSDRSHHRLVEEIAMQGRSSGKLQKFFDDLRDQAGTHDILLSAESMWRHATRWTARERRLDDPAYFAARSQFLQDLRGWLGDWRVRPILVLRSLNAFAQSSFKEGQVKYAEYRSFREYNDLGCARYDYDRQLDLIEEIFGRATTILYDVEAPRGELYRSVLRAAGIDDAPPSGEVRENRSPPNSAINWLTARHGGKGASPVTMEQARSFCRTRLVWPFLRKRSGSFWESRQDYEDFARRFRSSRFPELNADPSSPPGLKRWSRFDQLFTEALFQVWRLAYLPVQGLRRARARLGGRG